MPNLNVRGDVEKALNDLGLSAPANQPSQYTHGRSGGGNSTSFGYSHKTDSLNPAISTTTGGGGSTNMSSSSSGNFGSYSRANSRNFLYDSPSEAYFSQTSPSTSAVNVKTGSSVFSLDFSSDASTSNNNNTKGTSSKGKSFTGSKKQSQKIIKGSSIDKNNSLVSAASKRVSRSTVKASKSDEDWLMMSDPSVADSRNDPAFCVTPLLTSRSDKGRYQEYYSDEESEEDFITKVMDL